MKGLLKFVIKFKGNNDIPHVFTAQINVILLLPI